MREQFEKWYSDEGATPRAVERDARGAYKYSGAATAWDVWRAAWAECERQNDAAKTSAFRALLG